MVELKYEFCQAIDHGRENLDRGYRVALLLRLALNKEQKRDERRLMEQFWARKAEHRDVLLQIREKNPRVYSKEAWLRNPETADSAKRLLELEHWLQWYEAPVASGATLATDPYLMDESRGKPSTETHENFRIWVEQTGTLLERLRTIEG
ncbi:hypothetical protein [Sinomonas humi]|uniref:Uncharacterized protein n=1 Tax=Sinomonas humi TaxID=1338436 RepID=A0A0B2AP81_9MICC|nr:hypothetical protein [Sinomonas humi]KHL03794.1 hypothetical protein LK10_08370 [Sinomonas humi]